MKNTNRRSFLKTTVCVTGAGVSYAFSRTVTGRFLAGKKIVASDTLSEFDDQVVWLEANQFNDLGGWSNDSQHVDVMGSPYLLATGVGKPVADAVTTAKIPVSGTYRLWVRCRDWLPSHSPGQFQVMVKGQASPTTFGKSENDNWQWVDGGTYTLGAGDTEVRIHDLTGWWGRVDAIVLAPPAFEAAVELRDLEEQRVRYSGVTSGFKTESFDIVIAGGGPSGMGAAIAAARLGSKVALIQDRPVVGGNASSEIEVPPMATWGKSQSDDLHVTGIVQEIFGRIQGKTADPTLMLSKITDEENITLFLNTRVTGVDMIGATQIKAVKGLDVFSGQRLRFEAPLFIDCTGHAWVGFYAGAEYRMGREARHEFNESLAPLEAGPQTQGNTLYLAKWKTHSQPVPFKSPDWAYNNWESRDDFEGGHRHERDRHVPYDNWSVPAHGKGRNPGNGNINGGLYHSWFIEYGGMVNTIQDAEKIRDELFRINLGLWRYVKNHNPGTVQKNANRELIWLNYVPGVRESRRLMGDFILTQNDWDGNPPPLYEDTIAFTDGGIDVHHPEGFWVKGPAVVHTYVGVRVNIPYRTLYSKNISNLLMAGRCHSATQMGHGGTRNMRYMACTGQAAGTAAHLVLKYSTNPRGIYSNHVPELQQLLLKEGCYLVGTKNTDPNDLARTATVTASSTASGYSAADVINGWNRVVGENLNAWAPVPGSGPHWLELNLPAAKVIDTVHVTFEEYQHICEVQVLDGGTWKTVGSPSPTGKPKSYGGPRRVAYSITPVTTNKVRVISNNDVRLCEIRLYRDRA